MVSEILRKFLFLHNLGPICKIMYFSDFICIFMIIDVFKFRDSARKSKNRKKFIRVQVCPDFCLFDCKMHFISVFAFFSAFLTVLPFVPAQLQSQRIRD